MAVHSRVSPIENNSTKQSGNSPPPQSEAKAADSAAAADARLVVVVVIWFASSIVFNITAAKLLKLMPDAEDMTVIELFVTVLVAALSLSFRGMRLLPAGGLRDWPAASGLGALHLLNCRSFVYSLQFIPTALAQTIRATNPVWVVGISTLLGQRFGGSVLMSLLPLVGGFALAVGAEPGSLANPQGLAAAICSVNAQVCVNLLGQRRLSEKARGDEKESVAPPHPFELQFMSCLFALFLLLPVWFCTGGADRFLAHWQSSDAGTQQSILLMSALDGFLYFTEQTASFSALQSFQPLTFAVIDTLRRLSIVMVAGFWVQGTVLTANKAIGILLVVGGGLCFAYARDKE
ncbi:unnamed protein product, partial [Polarella glacialis]